ncbi:MAG: nuclear transport factor 2 family protein [Candidatus Kariarchaeaceae archaeon]|jgi:hypothetical protein
MDDTKEIRDLIDTFVYHVGEKNLEETVNLFKKDHFGMGSGENETHATFEQLKKHWEISFTLDEIHIENLRIYNLKVIGNVAWCFFNFDSTWVKNEEVVYKGKLRFSLVCERDDDKWLISQLHASVPQIGVDETTGMPTRTAIKNKIDELINEFELYSDHDTERKAIREYLEKAKEIAVNL